MTYHGFLGGISAVKQEQSREDSTLREALRKTPAKPIKNSSEKPSELVQVQVQTKLKSPESSPLKLRKGSGANFDILDQEVKKSDIIDLDVKVDSKDLKELDKLVTQESEQLETQKDANIPQKKILIKKKQIKMMKNSNKIRTKVQNRITKDSKKAKNLKVIIKTLKKDKKRN